MDKVIYTEEQKKQIIAYFDAKTNAKKQINKLLKKHSLKYKPKSIVETGCEYYIPKHIADKIKEINKNIETLKNELF